MDVELLILGLVTTAATSHELANVDGTLHANIGPRYVCLQLSDVIHIRMLPISFDQRRLGHVVAAAGGRVPVAAEENYHHLDSAPADRAGDIGNARSGSARLPAASCRS